MTQRQPDDAGDIPVLEHWAAARGVDPAALARHLPHLAGKTWVQIEAEAAAWHDPEAFAELDRIEREFAGADAETARMLDQEEGAYPYTPEEWTELQRLAAVGVAAASGRETPA